MGTFPPFLRNYNESLYCDVVLRPDFETWPCKTSLYILNVSFFTNNANIIVRCEVKMMRMSVRKYGYMGRIIS